MLGRAVRARRLGLGGEGPKLRLSGRLVTDVAAGLLVASVAMTIAVSVGALLAGAAGPEYVPRGIGIALTSSFAIFLAIALLGTLRGATPCTQDAPAAVLAGAAAGVVAAVGTGGDVAFATVMTLSALTTLTTGLLFMVVGWLRLGGLVRFLPYPVMGGFLAGTGWLLLLGGLSVMTGSSVEIGSLAAAVDSRWLYTALPGLLLAVVLLVASRRVRTPVAYPALVLAGILVFYLVLLGTGGDLAAWRAEGLLVETAGGGLLFSFRPSDLAAVDWNALASGLPVALTVPVLSMIAILLNVTAMEYQVGERVDLNRQLRAAGFGNLVSGGLGGMVGYHAVSLSTLNHRAGSGSRLSVLVGAGAILAALVLGGSVVEYLPRPVIGGVVSFLGLGFLYDWLWMERRRLAPVEFAIVLAILLTVIFSGFLQGVGLGLLLTVLLFVVNYGRIDPVRYAVSGAELRSRVRRSSAEESVLAGSQGAVLVMQLQGFLFFGTTARVTERVLSRLSAGGLGCVVLDMSRVTGLDASGVMTLRDLARRASDLDCRLFLAEVPGTVMRALRRGGAVGEDQTHVKTFPTVDAALEEHETTLLVEAGVSQEWSGGTLTEVLEGSGLGSHALEPYVERVELDTGDLLVEEGAPADGMYLIASGRVTASRQRDDAAPERLESMGAGSVVGEVGLHTGLSRGATVTADEPTVAYCLTKAELARMSAEDPVTAVSFNAWLARRMADRIAHLMATVEALRR